jgi:acyl carrier protein
MASDLIGRPALRNSTVEFAELRQLMADIFECDVALITPDATPQTVPAWDSLRLLDLILAIELQAQIEISPDELEKMMSVPAILQIIRDARAS